MCDNWIEVADETSINAARKIGEARVDCLIELGGFTGNNRLIYCATNRLEFS